MNCRWCHNPETQVFQKQFLIDLEKCTGCGACIASCPCNAIEMAEGRMVTDQEKCIVCGECTTFCLSNIRKIAGKEYIVRELVKSLYRKGVTVTIDTCGFAPYDNFKRLLPYHNTGSNKYRRLETIYKGTIFETTTKEEMEHFIDIKVAGYSDHFRNLSKTLQDEIIN